MSRLLPDPDVAGAWMVRVGDADQSWIDPDDPTRLEFDYMQRIADHLDVHRPAGGEDARHPSRWGRDVPRAVCRGDPSDQPADRL